MNDEAMEAILAHRQALLEEVRGQEMPVLHVDLGDVKETIIIYSGCYDDTAKEDRDLVEKLTENQLILLATGDISKGQGEDSYKCNNGQLGNDGSAVPGSAAQTSNCASSQGLADIVLADGPAGLRITPEYEVVDGLPIQKPLLATFGGGFLISDEQKEIPGVIKRYQYCTAFPVGTLLAQSWDTALIRSVGEAVAQELVIFGVSIWLAPGMNIHRNPLCGRNFEYFSEDPVLSGMCGAAMTEGVQSVKGVGTTIKHFACNNQEDNRMGSNSILSERVLREIYLKGFEIAVKKTQPMAMMTGYNVVNGVHCANSYDLCTKVARCEWGFQGVIMTDWGTTVGTDAHPCTAAGCMRAGNDLIMPGASSDHNNIRSELKTGTLSIRDLKRSVARLVRAVRQSNF